MNLHSEQEENNARADASRSVDFTASTGASAGLEFISGQRSEQEYHRAFRHTRRVKFLKLAMPIAGGLIILGFVITLIVRQFLLPGVDIASINIEDGKLVMENPSLNGFDRNKRPFQLSADRAIQDADQPKRVELVKISATLPMDETVSAEISAGNGIYDADTKILILTEQIHLETTDGIKIDLENADVDVGEGTLTTLNPVFASSPQADISALGLRVEDSGERLVFEGQVRMTLRPANLKKGGLNE